MPEPPVLSLDEANRLYRSIGDPSARAFFDRLIDHPGEQLGSESLQSELGFAEHKDVALAAHAIGKVASSLSLERPWLEGQRGYTMSPEQADALRAARDSG
jgi:hypothetical protein